MSTAEASAAEERRRKEEEKTEDKGLKMEEEGIGERGIFNVAGETVL